MCGRILKNIQLGIYKVLHWIFQNLCCHWSRWRPEPLGLIPLIIHRDLLCMENLFPAPLPPVPRNGEPLPLPPPKKRPDDGYGTDRYNPWASAEGAPFGRNCPAIPLRHRNPEGGPDVQLVAQRLLARDGFHPAADQLNVMAACWIQAMVHDWVGHYDGERDVELANGASSGCPMHSFKFKNTKMEVNGSMNSFRTNWWDASFVYGNNSKMLDRARTFRLGQLKVNEKDPGTLPQNPEDGTNLTGDNKNSWVGVSLLQELFLREHNAIAMAMHVADKKLNDQELFDKARIVIAALVAKIHTIDWTVELLKTYTLRIGMRTNWMGLPAAISSCGKNLPPLFRLIKKKEADNKGVPFCLTEEFTAVYRLHPMLPPGVVIGKNRNEFIPMEKLVGDKGRETIRAMPGRNKEFWDSMLYYPCGHLVPHNYPVHLRKLFPTTDDGKNLDKSWLVDLAALDLYRDRERGILFFNDFRRSIGLKPYKSWEALVGSKRACCGGVRIDPSRAHLAEELEQVYGPAPEGIEKLDLLVGDMYEGKLDGFAISETSFIIFLLMASRRLDADPFLNEYYNKDYYTQTGLDWIESVEGLKDLLERHYPSIASKIPEKYSAFKPYGTKEEAEQAWKKAEPFIDLATKKVWQETKAANNSYFGHGINENTPLMA